jgi:hypothetical protein
VDDAGWVFDPVGSGVEVLQGFDLVAGVDAGGGELSGCCVQVVGVQL